jgi:phosphopantetheinyl transferase
MLLGFHLAEQIQWLFVGSIDSNLEALIDYWFTAHEREQISQLSDGKRINRVLGHMAAKKVLVQLLGVSPHDITINHHPSGTPFAQVMKMAYPVSLSHVQRCGAAMTAAEPNCHIGIDIAYDHGRDIANLIERIATPEEREWLFAGETRRRFFELWSLKEAALKAWGVGMRVAPWEVEVTFQQGGTTTIAPIAMDYPELRGTIVHVPDTALVVGTAWSDGPDARVWAACRQPRGLHIGC